MKIYLLFFTAFLILNLTLYSNSLTLNKYESRFLQAETNSTSHKTPFEKMVEELQFTLTDEGKPTLQKLAESEFAAANKNKDDMVSEEELKKRLQILVEKYKVPGDIVDKPLFNLTLSLVQKDNDPYFTKAEFEHAILYGVKFLLPYLLSITGTPIEKLINAEGYMQEIKISLDQEKYDSSNNFQNLWLQISQGYSSISIEAANEFIGELCYSMGYPESQSDVIKKIVIKQSENNSLVRDDFEKAARDAFEETYDYLEETQIPSLNKEVEKYLKNNQANVVSIFIYIYLIYRK